MRDTFAARERIARQSKWAFILVLVVGGLITTPALMDVVFGLGWGYQWQDILVGAIIIAASFVVYGASLAIFRFTADISGKR